MRKQLNQFAYFVTSSAMCFFLHSRQELGIFILRACFTLVHAYFEFELAKYCRLSRDIRTCLASIPAATHSTCSTCLQPSNPSACLPACLIPCLPLCPLLPPPACLPTHPTRSRVCLPCEFPACLCSCSCDMASPNSWQDTQSMQTRDQGTVTTNTTLLELD